MNLNFLSPGWFTTMGTPLVAGRDFDSRDRVGGRERGDRQPKVRGEVFRRGEPHRAHHHRPGLRRGSIAARRDRRARRRRGLHQLARVAHAHAVLGTGARGRTRLERDPHLAHHCGRAEGAHAQRHRRHRRGASGPRALLPTARRVHRRITRAGTADRDALGFLWRACAVARGARPVRHHRVWRIAASGGAGHSHGARRLAAFGGAAGDVAHRLARARWNCARRRGELVGVAVRGCAAFRAAAHGPGDDRRRDAACCGVLAVAGRLPARRAAMD